MHVLSNRVYFAQSYEVWDANQARQFKSALERHHKDMWKSWKKAADNKPHKVMLAPWRATL